MFLENKLKRNVLFLYKFKSLKFTNVRNPWTMAMCEKEKAEWNVAKPYSEIPGPKPLPIPKYGNVWRVIANGSTHGQKLMTKLIEEYGPIVRFAGFGHRELVIISDPRDVERVFRTEGHYPVRKGMDSMEYYRRHVRADVYGGNPGLGTSQGELWHENRAVVNQHIVKPKNVQIYKRPSEEISDQLIERMKTIRNEKSEMPPDFKNELYKWALESVAAIALDARLGCLDGELEHGSEPQMMIDAVENMFTLMFALDLKPSLWKMYSTSKWNKFVEAMDYITNVSVKHVTRKKEEIERRGDDWENKSILEYLIHSKGGEKTAAIVTMDLIIAGVDTISNSLANALYFLSKHPEAQELVYEEAKKLLPGVDDHLPHDFEFSIPYLKACIKETHRLAAITFGTQRAAGRDIVLHGYKIPAGTHVFLSNQTMCWDDHNFLKPKEFLPERWLVGRDSPLSARNAHPFACLPFSFGPRMCVGRRLAELEMRIVLLKIIRHFKLSYPYENMEWKMELITTPAKPLTFRVDDRLN